jgi:hypothetical protein
MAQRGRAATHNRPRRHSSQLLTAKNAEDAEMSLIREIREIRGPSNFGCGAAALNDPWSCISPKNSSWHFCSLRLVDTRSLKIYGS